MPRQFTTCTSDGQHNNHKSNHKSVDKEDSSDPTYSNGLDDVDLYSQVSALNQRNPNVPTSLKDLAQFIKSDTCQSIIVLAGAGMSLASGICHRE